jgi:hypothetical protein
MTTIRIHDRYAADSTSAPGVAALLMAVRAGRAIEAVSFLKTAMNMDRHDAAAVTLVLGGHRKEHTLTERQRAYLTPFLNSLERGITLEKAIKDKAYMLIDVELVVEEAFAIDADICARVLVETGASRDLLRLKENRRAMRNFLRALDDNAPVLWLNAVHGVYRYRTAVADPVGV